MKRRQLGEYKKCPTCTQALRLHELKRHICKGMKKFKSKAAFNRRTK